MPVFGGSGRNQTAVYRWGEIWKSGFRSLVAPGSLPSTASSTRLSAGDYEKVMSQLIAEGKTRFVVDFAKLDYISSAGLRVLLTTAKQLKPKGGAALFANVPGHVREVFAVTGFDSILELHETVDAALAAL